MILIDDTIIAHGENPSIHFKPNQVAQAKALLLQHFYYSHKDAHGRCIEPKRTKHYDMTLEEPATATASGWFDMEIYDIQRNMEACQLYRMCLCTHLEILR